MFSLLKENEQTSVTKKFIVKSKLEGEVDVYEGNFNFELSPTIITKDLIPIKKITFDWCVETSQAEMIMFGEDKILEMFGDKLKQDFIKLTKNQ